LHRRGVELPVSLSAGTADGRALPAIEHAELDATGISHPTHQAIERVDLANQMTLAKTANGGIAGHCAYGRETVRNQGSYCAHPSGGGRGLTAGVTAANHDDVEALSLCSHGRTSSSQSGKPEVETRKAIVSRETLGAIGRIDLPETTPCKVESALSRLMFHVKQSKVTAHIFSGKRKEWKQGKLQNEE